MNLHKKNMLNYQEWCYKMTYYRILLQSKKQNLEKVLILNGKTFIHNNYHQIISNLPDFDLLYLDVNKGVAQGANNAPRQMTVLGEDSPSIFKCR